MGAFLPQHGQPSQRQLPHLGQNIGHNQYVPQGAPRILVLAGSQCRQRRPLNLRAGQGQRPQRHRPQTASPGQQFPCPGARPQRIRQARKLLAHGNIRRTVKGGQRLPALGGKMEKPPRPQILRVNAEHPSPQRMGTLPLPRLPAGIRQRTEQTDIAILPPRPGLHIPFQENIIAHPARRILHQIIRRVFRAAPGNLSQKSPCRPRLTQAMQQKAGQAPGARVLGGFAPCLRHVTKRLLGMSCLHFNGRPGNQRGARLTGNPHGPAHAPSCQAHVPRRRRCIGPVNQVFQPEGLVIPLLKHPLAHQLPGVIRIGVLPQLVVQRVHGATVIAHAMQAQGQVIVHIGKRFVFCAQLIKDLHGLGQIAHFAQDFRQ